MKENGLNLLFAILLLLSLARAGCLDSINPAFGANPSFFNMSDPTNQGICNSNFSAHDTFYYLIHNTFQEAPLLPSVRGYNLLLPFSCPPNGTEMIDKNYIHNAWVRAITIMPSITDEDGNYWALPNGEVLSAYNYSISLPRSATNSYPDCGIVYTPLNSSAQLSVYANGDYTGNSTLASYGVNSTNLNVTAELSISASVRRDYYEPYCYCCKSSKEGCEETCCYCKFSNSDVDNEQANPTSSLARKVYNLEASPNLTMLQCPSSSTAVAFGNFSLSANVPVQSVSLSFGNASSTLYINLLDVMIVLEPHNVIEALSLQFIQQASQKMFITEYSASSSLTELSFTGVLPQDANVSNAGLVVTDLFGVEHNLTNYTPVICPLNPQMELNVPHWAERGSSFQAVVKLSEAGRGIPNKQVKLHYSGADFAGVTNSQGEVDFALVANQSAVTAESKYDCRYSAITAEAVVVVYDSYLISFFLSFLAFLFILVLSYIAVRLMVGGGR